MISKNYEFFMKTNLQNYIGEWIAICNQDIVAHGSNAKKVFNEVKQKHPNERPLLTKVPDKGTMIF